MKYFKIILAMALACGFVVGAVSVLNNSNKTIKESSEDSVSSSLETVETIFVSVNNEKLEIKLEDNSSARELVKLLEKRNITVNMSDYGGFEKVGNLGAILPQNDESITTSPGDIILYQGNKITIYYDINNWSLTRLGKIQDVTQEKLIEILGDGSVNATFSLE